MSRSVRRCCTSISSTASRRMFGLSDVLQSSKKSAKAALNFGLSLWASSIFSTSPAGQVGHALLEFLDGLA